MLMPSRTAASARAQSVSSASLRPSTPCSAGHVVPRMRDLNCPFAHFGNGADLLKVRIGEDRLTHLQALLMREPLHVEQVRPRPDDRDETHDQLFADRIDRRIGHLREVRLKYVNRSFGLLDNAEIGVSLPMEPTASSPWVAMGVIRMRKSSCV